MRTIEIEGGLVRIIDREVVLETDLAAALPFMENRVPVMLPILPRNPVRSVFYDESDPTRRKMEIMISVDPAVRTLDYDRPIDNLPPRLSFPHTLFYFNMSTTNPNPTGRDWSLDNERVYFARERLTSMDQWVIPAVLPNVYEDGRICYGNTGVNAAQPLSDRLDELVNNWYITGFTNHHVRPYEWPWKGKTYKKWAQKTAADPNCWRDWPEWDRVDNPSGISHVQVKDIFNAAVPRDVPIVLPDGIPDLRVNPTFGVAEHWLTNDLDDTQRFRLKVALRNYEAAHGELTAPVVTVAPTDDDEDED